MISVLLLAAGESRRMGRPKMLLPFGTSTIVETAVSAALSSSADEILVVLGAGSESIREKLAHLSVRFAVNERYRLGMFSSIQCGIRHLSEQTEAVVIMLGDQPAIPASVVDRLIIAWREERNGLILPVFHGRRGHPLLVDMRYRSEIEELDPAAGMRALMHAHDEEIREVAVDSPSILRDIDTPEDYEKLRSGEGVSGEDTHRGRRGP